MVGGKRPAFDLKTGGGATPFIWKNRSLSAVSYMAILSTVSCWVYDQKTFLHPFIPW